MAFLNYFSLYFVELLDIVFEVHFDIALEVDLGVAKLLDIVDIGSVANVDIEVFVE